MLGIGNDGVRFLQLVVTQDGLEEKGIFCGLSGQNILVGMDREKYGRR